MKAEEFKTTHNLPFESAPWLTPHFIRFRVGTCTGLWTSENKTYDILAIENAEPGNGHLNDVFEWFENSCKRDGKKLRVLEVWNKGFLKHLVEKRGFSLIEGTENVIKSI